MAGGEVRQRNGPLHRTATAVLTARYTLAGAVPVAGVQGYAVVCDSEVEIRHGFPIAKALCAVIGNAATGQGSVPP